MREQKRRRRRWTNDKERGQWRRETLQKEMYSLSRFSQLRTVFYRCAHALSMFTFHA